MTPFHEKIAKDLFKGSLPDWQKDPVDNIIAEGVRRGRMLEEVAYVLANGYWETGRFKHRDEVGKGRGRDYGEAVLLYRDTRVIYYGRGLTQTTWLSNYAKFSVILSLEYGREIDLVNNPELAIEYEVPIMWIGMIRGSFTGKNLADYFGDGRVDYVGARAIINGNNKDTEIAAIARKFEAALHLLDTTEEVSQCPLNRLECPSARVAA